MPFVMDPDMARRFHKRFAGELALWQAQGNQGHLVVAGSFARRRQGTFDLIEVALMPVTGEWLPYESSDEQYLIAKTVAEKRRFVKGMRVNLDASAPIASLVLKDTGEDATAIHIHDGDTEASEPLEALLACARLGAKRTCAARSSSAKSARWNANASRTSASPTYGGEVGGAGSSSPGSAPPRVLGAAPPSSMATMASRTSLASIRSEPGQPTDPRW